MTEIIERFISDRLSDKFSFAKDGTIVDDSRFYNGTIITELLYRYQIINQANASLIRPANDPETLRSNYRQIDQWLASINIDLSEDVLNELIACKTSTVIMLFYELYLTLTDEFYKKHRKRTVKLARNRPLQPDDKLSQMNVLKTLLLVNEEKIDWTKVTFEQLLECYKAKKLEYVELCKTTSTKALDVRYSESSEFVDPLNDFVTDASCKELIDELINVDSLDGLEHDADQSTKLLQAIRENVKEGKILNSVRYKLHRMLLQKLWEVIVKKQNRAFESGLREQLLEQAAREERTVVEEMRAKELEGQRLDELRKELKEARDKADALFAEMLFRLPDKEDESVADYYRKLYKNLRTHRELYERKLAQKRERYKQFCEEVFASFVDAAIRFAEYREEHHRADPNWIDRFKWRSLFVDGEPILTKAESEFSLCSCEEEIAELEEINEPNVKALVDDLYDKYVNYEEPFTEVDDPADSELIESSRLGANVLGFIVHLLLSLKYPKPTIAEPIDVPAVQTATCLVGLTDLAVLPHLQKLLIDRGIVVVLLEECVKYCIDAYKQETTVEYTDPPEATEKEKTKGKKDKKKEKGQKNAKDKSSKGKNKKEKESAKGSAKKAVSEPQFADKMQQTPYIYPCEEIELSQKAGLGKLALDHQESDIPLSDELKVNILVVYLKSLDAVKGWTIVNFPESFVQAALFEEQLTGKPLLPTRQSTTEIASNFPALKNYMLTLAEEQSTNKCRFSSLLPNPKPEPPDDYYETFLTAYITLKEATEEEPEPVDYVTTQPPSEDDEDGASGLTETGELLEEFYTDQGCHYEYRYQKLDFLAVKQIAKLIVGEYTLPPKPSLELFGLNLAAVQNDMTDQPKSASAKSSKRGKGNESPKKSKKEKPVAIERCDKELQAPSIPDEPLSDADDLAAFVETESSEREAEPGEPDWTYVALPIVHGNRQKLASCWERIEDSYIRNVREFLLLHHVNVSTHVPYAEYVRRFVEASSVYFDGEQQYVDEFQRLFNAIVERVTEGSVQNALQCRVKELRETLLTLIDQRTFYMESIRKCVIDKNWVASQVIELINLYVLALQAETNRCVESIRLIDAYYGCLVRRRIVTNQRSYAPTETGIAPLRSDGDVFGVTCIAKYVASTLTNAQINVDMDPVTKIIDAKVRECEAIVGNARSICSTSLDETALLFNPSLSENYKRFAKTRTYVEPSREVRAAHAQLLREWRYAVDGEYARTRVRLSMLRSRARHDWSRVIALHAQQFGAIRQRLCRVYERDVSNANKICEIFARAVKTRTRLDRPLRLIEANEHYFNTYRFLFAPNESVENVLFKSSRTDFTFDPRKLSNLIDVLYDLAPSGYASKRTIVYVLQDCLACDEGKRHDVLPCGWFNLEPACVALLIDRLYGTAFDWLDWKDFVVRNMNVEYPTHAEMLEARADFLRHDPQRTETIRTCDFYDGMRLWFDAFGRCDVRVRNVLVKLYRTASDRVNYTRLLLAFCKDNDATEGFAKAIELSLGDHVCYDRDVGDDYVAIVYAQRHEHEEAKRSRELELAEMNEIALAVLSDAIDETLHLCDGVVIEDYRSDGGSRRSESIDDEAENDEPISKSDVSPILTDVTDVSIGFERRPFERIKYVLPYETLRKIVYATVPRRFGELHARYMDKMTVIYEQCKREDFNGQVLVHEFLSNVHFQEMLADYNRYRIERPEALLRKCTTNK